jgi:hypothetical protein
MTAAATTAAARAIAAAVLRGDTLDGTTGPVGPKEAIGMTMTRRARKNLERTVPMGTPRARAASSYDNPIAPTSNPTSWRSSGSDATAAPSTRRSRIRSDASVVAPVLAASELTITERRSRRSCARQTFVAIP